MQKFKVTEDIFILDNLVLSKDSEVEFDEFGQLYVDSVYGQMKLTKESLKEKIRPITQELKVNISLIDENDDIPKYWRLQLDFKASKKKVIEIEQYLKNTLQEML
jgi:hypothetical protein